MSLAPIHGIFIPRWRSGSFPWIWKWQSGDSYLPIVVHTCTFRSKWLGELIDCCCHGALTTKVTRPDNYIWPEICMIWALRRTSSVIDVGTNLEYKMGQHLFGLRMLTQIAFFLNILIWTQVINIFLSLPLNPIRWFYIWSEVEMLHTSSFLMYNVLRVIMNC